MHLPKLLAALAIINFCSSAHAESFKMDVLETDDLRLLYFDPPQTYLTPHVGRSFHNSLIFQRRIFDWEPWDKTSVLLKDFSDYGNAAARSSPNNALLIDVAPLSRAFETFTASERIYALMNHELVHVATMDVWNKRDDMWRRFFQGKPMPLDDHPESILYNYLATPRVNVPRWYLEGSAVFMETWMGGGLGRAQGAYDEMVFRSKVRDNAEIYDALGLVSEGTAVDFQVGVNAYLYGTRFMSYMALEHSPEKLVEWFKRGEGSRGYYSQQFKQVYGQSLNSAWDDWIRWERDFQHESLASIRENPITKGVPLTQRPLGSVSRAYYNEDRQSLIGAFRYPGVVAHVGELSTTTGKIRHLRDIKGPMLYRVTSLAYDPVTDKAWYTADNYAYRDLMEVDVASGKTRKLITDARIGELIFNPADKSLWGVRHLNGLATLVRLEAPYTKWTQIHTFPYGQILYDTDISADGQFFSTSLGEISGQQFLKVFKTADLLSGVVKEQTSFNFGQAVPEGFVFSADGHFLFGSSYYTGVSNIFRFDTSNGEMEALTNAETGFFRPIPRADGSLIAYEYTGQGFQPVALDGQPVDGLSAVKFLGAEVAEKHPVVDEWAVGSPAEVPLDDLVTHEGDYVPIRNLGLGSMYPIVEGYKDKASIGWHMNFEDPMQFNKVLVTASYSPDKGLSKNERWHADVKYQAINWYVRYWHNDADFYDLFGPKERSRKGDAWLAGYKKTLVYDKPRQWDVSADVAYYTGLDTLPGNQNVAASAGDILSGDIALHYTNTRKSLGSVDHEKGYRWEAGFGTDYASDEVFTKFHSGMDFGFALPVKHSSVWFYSSAGIASGDKMNPLSRFYFGGYGNNYVDNDEVKRYREYNAFPGFEIDAIAARNFVKSTAELNLPPFRFKGAGIPSLYLSYIRPAAFFGTMVTDPGDATERTVLDAGFQIDLHFTLAHRLPMTLSLGYAAGFEHSDKQDDEFMISLKIL